MPLTVLAVNEIDERDGGIHYVWEATLIGPRSGKMVLKESEMGRIMAFPRGEEPALTARHLRWFNPSEDG